MEFAGDRLGHGHPLLPAAEGIPLAAEDIETRRSREDLLEAGMAHPGDRDTTFWDR